MSAAAPLLWDALDDGTAYWRAEFKAGARAARRDEPWRADASQPWLDGWTHYNAAKAAHCAEAWAQLQEAMRT